MALAQQPQIENRRLTWEDFRGQPAAGSPFDAYTYWTVRYRYEAPRREADGLHIVFRVWNQLGERSWVKAHTPREHVKADLLNHEQGHYTIGVLCALEFKQTASARRFGENYDAEIRGLFDEILKKYLTLEKAYDAETRHMQDRERQKAWDLRLARMVEERWGDR